MVQKMKHLSDHIILPSRRWKKIIVCEDNSIHTPHDTLPKEFTHSIHSKLCIPHEAILQVLVQWQKEEIQKSLNNPTFEVQLRKSEKVQKTSLKYSITLSNSRKYVTSHQG